jgi:hypothetical protein
MNSPRDPIDQDLHRVLRALPDQRAPQTLEARVMAALAERATLPWWRRSYAGWPLAVQIGFFLLSGLSAAGLIFGLARLPAWLDAGAEVSRWQLIYNSLLETANTVFSTIPTPYLYGGLAVLAACYLTLAGIGAAAYRTFFARS